MDAGLSDVVCNGLCDGWYEVVCDAVCGVGCNVVCDAVCVLQMTEKLLTSLVVCVMLCGDVV